MAGSLDPTFLDRYGFWTEIRSVVYFIEGGGAVKIGTSTRLRTRARELQACSPVRLAVVAVGLGGECDERRLHDRYAEHRLHGEWFAAGDWLRSAVESFEYRAVALRSLGMSTVDPQADYTVEPPTLVSVGRGSKCCAFRRMVRGGSGLAVCASCGGA